MRVVDVVVVVVVVEFVYVQSRGSLVKVRRIAYMRATLVRRPDFDFRSSAVT